MFRSSLLLSLVTLLSLIPSAAFAQTYEVTNPKRAAFARVIEDSRLPRVLIIGDSISIGYTPALREQLKGVANVHRIPTNGGPTTRGLEQIDAWLGDTQWDVIHFNWGLHDLKFVNNKLKSVSPSDGEYQVPLPQYEKNLRQLVKRLQKTNAKLIWRNTTPVPANSNFRIEGDEEKYNAVAARIMQENEIPIDDHCSYVMKHMAEVQRPANVHFTPAGSAKLAELAAVSIRAQLPTPDQQ